MTRSIEEDLTRKCLYGFSLRLSIGIFALEDEVKLIANLQAKELLLEGREHHAHALDILEGTVGGGFLHEGTFVLIADVQFVLASDELVRCYRHNGSLSNRFVLVKLHLGGQSVNSVQR